MKKVFITALLAACMGLSACYDDSADIQFYSGEQLIDQVGTCTNLVSYVTLYLNGNKQTSLGIAYGKGGYQAVSSDTKVVKVDIKADRLILTAGGEEGNATVTVTDEKGNQAVLTVESCIYTCTYSFVSAEVFPMSEGAEVTADLKSAVKEALADYAPVQEGARWVLVPDKRNSGGAEQGTLTVYASSSAQPVEGTYTRGVTEEHPAYVSPYVYDFTYGGESHHFYLTDVLPSGRSRSLGVLFFYWLEDVTERFHAASPSVVLPEGVKVYYAVEFTQSILRE